MNEDTQLLRRRIRMSRKTGLVEGFTSGRGMEERKKKRSCGAHSVLPEVSLAHLFTTTLTII